LGWKLKLNVGVTALETVTPISPFASFAPLRLYVEIANKSVPQAPENIKEYL
jgi:hypothetical protein